MTTKFLQITETESRALSVDPNQVYTPAFYDFRLHLFYKDEYTETELENCIDLDDEQLDGLTPIDPTKPMFPRKP
jgi:hypothetical protein